mmetsp:Transcript_4749/g.15332  ORF Transcript_4749/g.15332 Transcript_4749/m.15332 type:complete len:235 (+) Transcript_4749:93-797(+)
MVRSPFLAGRHAAAGVHRVRVPAAVLAVVVPQQRCAAGRLHDQAAARRRRLGQGQRLVWAHRAVGGGEGGLAAALDLVEVVKGSEQAREEGGRVVVHPERRPLRVVDQLNVLPAGHLLQRKPRQRGEPLLKLAQQAILRRREEDAFGGALARRRVAHRQRLLQPRPCEANQPLALVFAQKVAHQKGERAEGECLHAPRRAVGQPQRAHVPHLDALPPKARRRCRRRRATERLRL